MALKFDDAALKNINTLVIDCGVIQQVGTYIFNNLGADVPEYEELCIKLKDACKSLITETEKLTNTIPGVR